MFDAFKALHHADAPLVLYNAWDAGSAKAIEEAGAKAIATGSWSVAAAQGFEDGEAYPFERLVQTTRDIHRVISIPLSVDMEAGYCDDPERVADHALILARAGAVGINLEDRNRAAPGLAPTKTHVHKIKAIKQRCIAENVQLFINARCDVFLNPTDQRPHTLRTVDALERAQAYTHAGADGIFLPFLRDIDLLSELSTAISAPINVLVSTHDEIPALRAAGAKRISFGPNPYRHAMTQITEAARTAFSA